MPIKSTKNRNLIRIEKKKFHYKFTVYMAQFLGNIIFFKDF